MRHRGEIRRVCFNQQAFKRQRLDHGLQRGCILEGRYAGNGNIKAHLHRGLGHLQGFGETVQHTAHLVGSLFTHDLQGILLGITGVNDQRLVQGTSDPDVFAEGGLLHLLVFRRVEVVEPGFPDGHHSFIAGLRQQQLGIDTGFLIERMHATGSKHLGIRGDRRQHGRKLCLGDTYTQKVSHVLLRSLGQHVGHVGLLAAIAEAIEVAMGINE